MKAAPITFDGRRTIPSAEVTRIMLELLELEAGDKVLEIGTGSASQTQEFAKTGAEVHSIELEPWVDPTQVTGDCVYLHTGDGARGLYTEAPFTAIVATCGVEQIPSSWRAQLSEGGRLVAPVGDVMAQRLTKFVKFEGSLVPVRVGAYVRFQMLREMPLRKEMKPVYA